MARLSLRSCLLLYAAFMAAAAAGVCYFVATAPPLPAEQCAVMPTFVDVLRGQLAREPKKSILDLWGCLREYKRSNWWHTTAGLWGVYVIFKILGPFGAGTSMVFSVLIGALYDEWQEPNSGYSLLAHLLGTSGELCGGCGGWIISYCIGREILMHFAGEKMALLKKEMDKFQGSLFRYMCFIRVSPLFPNWFVNYSTAIIGVPFSYFVVASAVALQPAACMSIAMGGMLRDVGETGLDLVKMGKRGAMMAAIMAALSMPLIPKEDYAKGLARVKGWCSRFQGKKQEADAAPAQGAAQDGSTEPTVTDVQLRPLMDTATFEKIVAEGGAQRTQL